VLLPFDSVVRRGVILLWKRYAELDDPVLAGQSKAKFLIVLSASPHDDPIVYILTTSQKPKHIAHPAPQDLLHLLPGAYECFTVDTLVDCGTAGEREVGRRELQALYEAGEVAYKGALSDDHCAQLMHKTAGSSRATRRVKRILGLGPAAGLDGSV